MSALKIVCKRKISRRLRKNLHIIHNLITIVNIAIRQFVYIRLRHYCPLSINRPKYVKANLELDYPNHNHNPESRWMVFANVSV